MFCFHLSNGECVAGRIRRNGHGKKRTVSLGEGAEITINLSCIRCDELHVCQEIYPFFFVAGTSILLPDLFKIIMDTSGKMAPELTHSPAMKRRALHNWCTWMECIGCKGSIFSDFKEFYVFVQSCLQQKQKFPLNRRLHVSGIIDVSVPA